MPTGYTDCVAKGEVTSLKEFALICARGMGALVDMRELPWDAPIPEKLEPNSYHLKALESAQRELNELEALMPEQLEAVAAQEYLDNVQKQAEYDASKRRQYENYSVMIEKVAKWRNSPEGLRSFMLDQLNKSIEWDCPDTLVVGYVGDIYDTEKLSGQEWKAKRKQALLKDISYHSEAYAKELERVAERNKWIKQLRESLEDA